MPTKAAASRVVNASSRNDVCQVVKRLELLIAASLAVTVASTPTVATGQEVYAVIDGPGPGQSLSYVEPIRDIDQDGVDDFATGAANGAIIGLAGPDGDLFFYSGASLTPIARITGVKATGPISSFAVLGDYDGDGFDDVAWGRGSGTASYGSHRWFHALIHSSHDRSQLARFDDPIVGGSHLWGWVVTGVGDIDQNGYDDVLVGGHDIYFRIFGGPDGQVLRHHIGHSGFASSAAKIGDVNLDGVPDYAIASGGLSRVTLFSGATGSVLRVMQRDWREGLGVSVAGVGDVNGDGIPDIAAGAPCTPSGCFGNSVFVFSGASGAILYQFLGALPNQPHGFGNEVAGGGDINGDGIPDLMASCWGSQRFVDVYSMRTGSLLWRHRNPIDAIGWPRVLGDLDGDGLSEWSVSSGGAQYAGILSGRIWIFRGQAIEAEPYCVALPNSLGRPASLLWQGPLTVGSTEQRFEVLDAIPSSFAQVLYGLPSTATPFGDGQLCVGGTTHRLDGPFALDSLGHGTKVVDWQSGSQVSGPGAWLPGMTLGLQAFYRDIHPGGAGFNTTDAWEVTFSL